MQGVLSVRWRVTPQGSPRILLHCARCERERPFASSGRFRVNAQKKRLDAWLIYRCSHCDKTWNYPVFERCAVQEVDAGLLQRMHANCPRLAAEQASDLAGLNHFVRGVEPVAARVEKRLVAGALDAALLTLALEVPVPLRWRLDRLLAAELAQSRAALARWTATGVLRVEPPQRAVRDGQVVRLALAGLTPAEQDAALRGAL